MLSFELHASSKEFSEAENIQYFSLPIGHLLMSILALETAKLKYFQKFKNHKLILVSKWIKKASISMSVH